MDAGTLYEALAEVSPITSCTVGKEDDRSTWTWVSGPGATQPQIDAGNNVIATIPINPKSGVASSEFIGRFTNAEYRAIHAEVYRQTGGNAKNWDVVVSDPVINLNKKKVTTLRTSLVADGLISETRATEIFS